MSLAGIALVAFLALAQAGTAAPDGPFALGPPGGVPFSGPALDARTNEVGALLRCPVCQGLSVADSPATMARNMKLEVREKLAAGYDQEQILAWFERSYGEFVRLRPPLRGMNWLVWLGPAAFLVVGGAVVSWALRSSRRQPRTPAPPSGLSHPLGPAALPDDPRLADAVRRVRALAYGWPDGNPPQTGSPR
jgi:cytochrome c-type biogenesis protein CcmH